MKVSDNRDFSCYKQNQSGYRKTRTRREGKQIHRETSISVETNAEENTSLGDEFKAIRNVSDSRKLEKRTINQVTKRYDFYEHEHAQLWLQLYFLVSFLV